MSMTKESLESYFKANPTAMDPKFGGDASKAAESVVNLQAAYTKTSQELAAIKKTATTPTPDPNTTTPDLSRNGSGNDATGSLPDGLSIPEPPKVADVWVEVETSVKQTGGISDEIATKMVAAGIPENVVQGFKRLVVGAASVAKQQQVDMAIRELGSREALDACLKFASTLPPAERAELNNGLKSEAWQTYLHGLNARRLKAAGNEPNRAVTPTGNGSGSGSGIVITSHKDLLRYQAMPQYRNDPAFQNAVIEASNRYYMKKK
jgi:hypothetical protein